MLCYFETLCGDTNAANILINSSLTILFIRMLKNAKAGPLRVKLASVLGEWRSSCLLQLLAQGCLPGCGTLKCRHRGIAHDAPTCSLGSSSLLLLPTGSYGCIKGNCDSKAAARATLHTLLLTWLLPNLPHAMPATPWPSHCPPARPYPLQA